MNLTTLPRDILKQIKLPMEVALYSHFISPFHFERSAYAVEAEGGIGLGRFADLLILCTNYDLMEIEVKRSWQDFLADFKHKWSKHAVYKTTKENGDATRFLIPHKFYFAFPTEELCKRAEKYLKENGYNYYGIYFATDNEPFSRSKVTVYHRCKKLHHSGGNSYKALVRHMRTSERFVNFFKDETLKLLIKERGEFL